MTWTHAVVASIFSCFGFLCCAILAAGRNTCICSDCRNDGWEPRK